MVILKIRKPQMHSRITKQNTQISHASSVPNHFLSHSAQRLTMASQLCHGAYTEHVQLHIVMRIYENTSVSMAGKLTLHWDLSVHKDTQGQVAFWVLPVSCYARWHLLQRNTESRLAIRPIVRWRQSFCWMRSLSQSSCIFPRHQRAPRLQCCCLRYHTVVPAGAGRKRKAKSWSRWTSVQTDSILSPESRHVLHSLRLSQPCIYVPLWLLTAHE